MVELTQLELCSGILSIIGILLVLVLGFFMIRIYFRNKNRNILLMGIVMILISEPWWPYGISVILVLTGGEILPLREHILIALVFQPLLFILGMIVMTDLMWEDKKKIILPLSAIYAAIYQTVIFYAFIVDPTRFATSEGPLDVRYKSFLALVLIMALIILIMISILFFRESRKSQNQENRLRGTLYLISGLSFVTGAILDAILPLSFILLLIVRILLASAAFEIYSAFAMPKLIKKIFLKEE
ncbi:MAG: hypothetical protein ACFFAH_02660 [Promethearchaeota archaeon]